jgi:hypothetical protein
VGAGNNCVGCLRLRGVCEREPLSNVLVGVIDPQMLEANGRCGTEKYVL